MNHSGSFWQWIQARAQNITRIGKSQWRDIDWCDENIRAAALSDGQVVAEIAKVNPYSYALLDLLEEARQRGLVEARPHLYRLLDGADPCIATEAVALLGEIGDSADVRVLLDLVEKAHDHYHMGVILGAVVTLSPDHMAQAVEIARTSRGDENFDSNFVRAALVSRLSQVLPDDFEGLETHLLGWANDERLAPDQREPVFRRLAKIPRSECVEDFFVQFYVHDKHEFPSLSQIVDDALSDCPGNADEL